MKAHILDAAGIVTEKLLHLPEATIKNCWKRSKVLPFNSLLGPKSSYSSTLTSNEDILNNVHSKIQEISETTNDDENVEFAYLSQLRTSSVDEIRTSISEWITIEEHEET